MAEAGGRAVERTITLPVTASGNMIGVKPLFSGRSLGEGDSANFDVIVLAPDGTTVPKRGLHYELLRIQTHYQYYKRDGSWNYEPVKQTSRVVDGEIDSSLDRPGHISMPVQWGRYRLEVSTGDGNGPVTSIEFDAGWYTEASADTPDMLEIALDKGEYKPGDTMTVAVTARTAGRVTLNVIGDRLLTTQTTDVQPGLAKLQVPVGRDWGNGAYVVATLRRPLDAVAQRMPGRAIGVQWFSVDRNAKTLALEMKMPALIRPNTTLRVPVKLDGLTTGEEARIVVAAVDVGILNLTNYKPPAPDNYFLGQRRLSAEVRDLYGQLIDGMQGTRGQIRSGGDEGAQLQGSPPTQAPLALYSGVITVGSNGSAEVAFDIPDFSGTARVMAVAWSKDKVGRASGDVTVRDPVVVTATLPRFLLHGDRGTVHLDLDNVEGQAGEYTVAVTSEGPVVAGAGATQKVALRAKQRASISIPVAASGAGTSTVRVALSGPGGFALERSYSLTVRSATQILARRTVKPIAKGESLTLSNDMFSDLVPGTGNVSISVGLSSALDAATLLKALDRYPYGCSEQITSRAMPLLYVNELAGEAHLAFDTAIDQRIRDAIDRLLARQGANGSFGLWSVGGDDAWLNSYVTDFLSRARERNFAVPDVAFKLALDRLRNVVANTTDPGKNGGRDLAYALYVLARNGSAPVGDLRYIADTKLDSLETAIAKAQVAAALAMIGDRGRAERVYAAALELDPAKANARPVRPRRLRLDAARCGGARHARLRRQRAAPDGDRGGAKGRGGAHAVDLHLDAGERLAGDGGARAGEGYQQHLAHRRRRGDAEAGLPHHPGERLERAAAHHQHRRQSVAGGGDGLRLAIDAGAGGGEGLQDRAQLLHARRRGHRYDDGQAEHAHGRGAEDHRAGHAIRPHHRRRLSAGRVRDRQSASRVVRRYRDAELDHRCGRAGSLGIPRRPFRRGVRPQGQQSVGVHRRLRGARRLTRQIRAPAGLRRGHVSSRPLRPHRHRHGRSHGGEVMPKSLAPSSPSPHGGEGRGEGARDEGARDSRVDRNPLTPTLSPSGRGGRRRAWRGLRITLAVFAVFLTASLAGAAWWIKSLGPAPIGEGIAFSTTVVDRDGRLLRPYAIAEGRWRLPATVADVDPRFFNVLFAYEDKRFRSHHGVDAWAVARAALQIVTHGHIVSGASTLTMQVVRLLDPPAERRSLLTKLRQMVRAVEIERVLTKDEVLSLYLDLAPYGGNLEGIRAASLAYFGKEPRKLSLGETALLVALPQSPELRRPDRSADIARRARNRVLDRFAESGIVPADEIALAKAEPVPTARLAMPALAPHAADQVVAEMPAVRQHKLTIDAVLQKNLETLARERARALGPDISVAILVVDNATGEVLARVASADYFDQRRAGQVDMTQAIRSPGSTLKPFIYGLGFEDGFIHPETMIEDRPVRYGTYAPENFDLTFQGTVTVRRALQMSLNVPAVAVLDKVGASRLTARLTASRRRTDVADGRGAWSGDGPRRRRHKTL